MTKPSLDLYPEPAPLSNPPTWEDIERLAMNYPSAHAFVTLTERGDLTREQALIAMVHWFATSFSRVFKREVEAQRLEVLETMTQEQCGCSRATYIRRRVSQLTCATHQADDAVDPDAGDSTE